MLDFQIFGLNSGGHHFTNVLLHALSTVLLLHVLFRMTGAFAENAWAAAFFALHPLRVESVAWVAERKDVSEKPAPDSCASACAIPTWNPLGVWLLILNPPCGGPFLGRSALEGDKTLRH
jgi:hypothetical protein